MQTPISRIAPTPSGYLHLGNIINFVYTWTLVRSGRGKLWLRIDDLDQNRTKEAYIEDIFSTLDWLGFDFDYGPSDMHDFTSKHSFVYRFDDYKRCVMELLTQNKAYACGCCRKELKPYGNLYPGFCKDKKLQLKPQQTSARIDLDDTLINLKGRRIDAKKEYGDFIIWRKEDIPSYHFASTLFDCETGINTVVRGDDLLYSTAAQKALAHTLGKDSFNKIAFTHHRLFAPNGSKLSKSNRDDSIMQMRKRGYTKSDILTLAGRFLGVEENVYSLKGFLPHIEAIKAKNG
ncbi:MAG: glutamate--tRNA ligase family protein [Campylobacterota bacterium]